MKENNHAPSSPARNGELVRAIKAKNDVFHMLDAVSAYLKIHADDPDADKQASAIMDMLKNAATTPLLRAENRAQNGGPQLCVCEGQDADWLWVYTFLSRYGCLFGKYCAADLAKLCYELRAEFYYGTPADPARAAEILADLEDRFGFLSRVIGLGGLHLVSLATIATEGTAIDVDCLRIAGGVHSVAQVLAVGLDRSVDDHDRQLCLTAIPAILEAADIWAEIPEDALALLERTTTPDILDLDLSDQMLAYFDAMLMGLSYQAPYGDFTEFRAVPDDAKRTWRDYVSRLIDSIDSDAEGRD